MAEADATRPSRRPAIDISRIDGVSGKRAVLESIGFEALLNLRGRPAEGDFDSAVQAVLGVPLPRTPNTVSQGARVKVLWLGPDEWLVIAADGQAAHYEDQLRSNCAADPWFAVVDVSHNSTGFRLLGPAARDVLAKGCPLDLHPRAFAPGRCAQSVLAGARVLLAQGADAGSFEIRVRNSFARYLGAWLADAMAEYRS